MANEQTETMTEDAQALLKNLQESLNEEKWTRATLSNYSTNLFKDLDQIIKKARSEKITDELKKSCDDHLSHTRNSIIALYISGIIAISHQIIDDSVIINLVSIFLENNKWNIVKYLCERILEIGESKFALRTLADCYKNDNEEENIYAIYERLVKVDYEDAEVAKLLADHYEKQNRKNEAVEFYKKALHRYIIKGNFNIVREIWEKLVILDIGDIDFFLHVQKIIAKTISEDKTVILLNELYSKYLDIDIDIAITILKIVLNYDEKDSRARKEIIDCFKIKYAQHSQLEEAMKTSNLSQSYRDVNKAIDEFEKSILFDKGNYVFHRSWGVGRISSIKNKEIIIDFSQKRSHPMSLEMAKQALQTLPKDHIWVLKAMKKKEELRERISAKDDENIIWTLKTIIKSFPSMCDMKKIKAELCPSLLSAGEWTAWNAKARKILKLNPDFGVNQENDDIITVRTRPVTVSEKLYSKFNAEKTFINRANTIRDYVNDSNTDPDSEFFTEMLSYFIEFLKSSSHEITNKTASWLLINELALNNRYSHLKSSLTSGFKEIFSKITDIPGLYNSLKDSKFKESFLSNVKFFINDWPQIYLKIFPYALSNSIITQLKDENFDDKLTVMCNNCFDNYRDYREAVVWLYKNSRDSDWFKAANLSMEKQIIILLHVLELTYRDIDNHKDTIENKKINKQVYNILFLEGVLSSFIENSNEETIIRIYAFINEVKDLDPQDKINIRSKILDKYPEFKFAGSTETKTSMGLIVTHAMYEDKRKQLTRLMDEEVPANSKEIEFALSLGDLRENAEYKAAKERQDQLNTQVTKLKDDIERAQFFDPRSIDTSKVSFGIKVMLYNHTYEKNEEYTILGPWESNPEKNIISYLSPFGNSMLNKAVGDSFDFLIDNIKNKYTIENIVPAEI